MKDERYNVFLLSSEGKNLDGIRSIEYSYDWNLLPEGEYELSFSFTTKEQIMTLAQLGTIDVAMVQLIGLNSYATQSGSQVWAGTNSSSQIIGLLQNNAAYHYTDNSSDKVAEVQIKQNTNNPPIRIRSVPQGKIIINLLKTDGSLAVESTVDEYVINLGLKRLC